MNRVDFQNLALLRLSDAQALLSTGNNSSGAYYIAGYAVECALKAWIAGRTQAGDWPPPPKEIGKYYTHDLEVLLKIADSDKIAWNASAKGTKVETNWGVVNNWSEEDRYRTHTQAEAEALIEAISNANHDGVMQWIQTYW